MLDVQAYLYALCAIAAAAFVAWMVSIRRRDVSIVDGLWSLMFLLCLLTYMAFSEQTGPRAPLILVLVTIWGVRLSLHITIRNHGQPEDRRYQEIRRNNQPRFWLKSLYIVFLLQGFLAWVLCLPVIAAVSGQAPPGPLDFIGIVVWLAGMVFETVGDIQLERFRKSGRYGDGVLDSGLWRFTRHPNYFGEALLWWGLYLIALSAGAWWTVLSPVLMTFLLLRVSGVALLERDITDRRPAYRDYMRHTNAFIPGRPRDRACRPEGQAVNGG